jgi:hypothetical protein
VFRDVAEDDCLFVKILGSGRQCQAQQVWSMRSGQPQVRKVALKPQVIDGSTNSEPWLDVLVPKHLDAFQRVGNHGLDPKYLSPLSSHAVRIPTFVKNSVNPNILEEEVQEAWISY